MKCHASVFAFIGFCINDVLWLALFTGVFSTKIWCPTLVFQRDKTYNQQGWVTITITPDLLGNICDIETIRSFLPIAHHTEVLQDWKCVDPHVLLHSICSEARQEYEWWCTANPCCQFPLISFFCQLLFSQNYEAFSRIFDFFPQTHINSSVSWELKKNLYGTGLLPAPSCLYDINLLHLSLDIPAVIVVNLCTRAGPRTKMLFMPVKPLLSLSPVQSAPF